MVVQTLPEGLAALLGLENDLTVRTFRMCVACVLGVPRNRCPCLQSGTMRRWSGSGTLEQDVRSACSPKAIKEFGEG